MTDRPKVVILGCGFGGLGASQGLKQAAADVTVLDQNDYHSFQPLLYQVATASLEPETVGHPIRALLQDHDHFRFHRTRVKGIDLAHRVVDAEGMTPIAYDYLIIALGAQVNFFGVPGAAEHAFPLYTLTDAVRLKKHLLRLFETADKHPGSIEQGALSLVVVGGGATGVETAGAMAELFSMDFAKDYPDLPASQWKITLVDGESTLLNGFNEGLQSYAGEALEKRGVELRLGERVAAIDAAGVALQSGARIDAGTVIWAGGLQASPAAKLLGIGLGHGGRVPVDADLSLAGHPEVFVIGDLAEAKDCRTDRILPQLAAVALQAGRHAAENVGERMAGRPTTPFEYHDKGTMATVGRGAAIAQLPHGVSLKGPMAWLAWGSVHLATLTGGDSRAATMVDWFWDLFRREHGKRIDIED
jgi:NADH dehydrogenase